MRVLNTLRTFEKFFRLKKDLQIGFINNQDKNFKLYFLILGHTNRWNLCLKQIISRNTDNRILIYSNAENKLHFSLRESVIFSKKLRSFLWKGIWRFWDLNLPVVFKRNENLRLFSERFEWMPVAFISHCIYQSLSEKNSSSHIKVNSCFVPINPIAKLKILTISVTISFLQLYLIER